MMVQHSPSAVPIDAPSPLVGEGSTGARYKLTWVRGWLRKHNARG
jgi:hypothetical protein